MTCRALVPRDTPGVLPALDHPHGAFLQFAGADELALEARGIRDPERVAPAFKPEHDHEMAGPLLFHAIAFAVVLPRHHVVLRQENQWLLVAQQRLGVVEAQNGPTRIVRPITA